MVQVDLFFREQLHSINRHPINCPLKAPQATVGFYNRYIQDTEGMTTTDKLVFIVSFLWMMQWGTRVTLLAINALY